MSKCQYTFCNNEVEQIPGKRPRQFCSDTCRQKQWHRNKNATETTKTFDGIVKRDADLAAEINRLRKENIELKNRVAELQPYETAHRLRLQKSEEVSKSSTTAQKDLNQTIEYAAMAEYDNGGTKREFNDEPPKNLAELKSRCPAGLSGIDKAIWVKAEREKYGL